MTEEQKARRREYRRAYYQRRKAADPVGFMARQREISLAWLARKKTDPKWVAKERARLRAHYQANREKVLARSRAYYLRVWHLDGPFPTPTVGTSIP